MASFRQRRFGVRTSFAFGSEHMTYGLGDWHRMGTETIPYEALDLSSRSDLTIGNTGYAVRWIPMLSLAAAPLWFLGVNRAFSAPPLLLLAIPAAVIGLIMAFELTAVHFTEIATFGADADGVRRFLRIIKGRHHDDIIVELERAWRDRLRQLYAHLDLAADPNHEAARFTRLAQLGVVDQHELEQAIDRLRAVAAAPRTGGGAPLH
jgi:hypothetical protein